MTTNVEIANLALAHCGVTQFITTLDDTSVEARLCALHLPAIRRATLRDAPWGFAVKRATLTVIAPVAPATAVVTGWAHTYALPADLLVARAIVMPGAQVPHNEERIPFEISSAGLSTNQASAELVYIADITDPALFDAPFIQTLAWGLAAELAPALAVSADLTKVATEYYVNLLAKQVAEGRPGAQRTPESPDMTGYVAIANLALSHCGAKKFVTSLDESSLEARLCALHIPAVRRATLRDAPWEFATKRASLVSSVFIVPGWTYTYEVPSDFIRARAIVVPGGRVPLDDELIPFEVSAIQAPIAEIPAGGVGISTDQVNAELVYTCDVNNPALFSALFVQALAWGLAAEISVALESPEGVVKLATEQYMALLTRAVAEVKPGVQRAPGAPDMTGYLAIANLALSHCGARKFLSTMAESSLEARLCALHLPAVRRATLRDAPWGFATRRVTLTLSAATVTGWAHTYTLPADCVTARAIVVPGMRVPHSDERIPFEVSFSGISTDQASAELIYTSNVDDPALFDALFVQALAWGLAVEIAPALGADKLSRVAADQYIRIMARASAATLREGMEAEPESTMISGRF